MNRITARYPSPLRRTARGFSLIELMVVVVIVSILAAVALPSYQNSVAKSRRTVAKTALLDLAARQEKYFSTMNQYTTDLTGTGSTGLGIPTTALKDGSNNLYTLSVVVNNATNPPTFTATATATGSQSSDSCGNFTVNNFGQQTPTTTGCW